MLNPKLMTGVYGMTFFILKGSSGLSVPVIAIHHLISRRLLVLEGSCWG